MYLADWKAQDRQPTAKVHKFVPGDHYHALGKKFDDLEDAKNHLSRSGYRFAGIEEKFVYAEQGG